MVPLVNRTMCVWIVDFVKLWKGLRKLSFYLLSKLNWKKLTCTFFCEKELLVAMGNLRFSYSKKSRHDDWQIWRERYKETEKIDSTNLLVDNRLISQTFSQFLFIFFTSMFFVDWRRFFSLSGWPAYGGPRRRRFTGRAAGCQCDGDVHGRVEEWQKGWIWHQRTIRRTQVRGRMVQQQEIRLWRHYTQGMRSARS